MPRLSVVFAGIGLVLAAWSTHIGGAWAGEPAAEWRDQGKYFPWKSTLPENKGRTAQVFYTCIGDAAKKVVATLSA